MAVLSVSEKEQLRMKETAESLKEFKIKKSLDDLAGDEKFTVAQFIKEKSDLLNYGLLNKNFYDNSMNKKYFWKERLLQKFGKFIKTENGETKTYFNFVNEDNIDWKQAYEFLTFYPIKDEVLARNLIETVGYLLLFATNVPKEFWEYLSKLYPEGSNKPKIMENFINASNKTLDLEKIQREVLDEIIKNYDMEEMEKYCIEILENNLWNVVLFMDIIWNLDNSREEFLLRIFKVIWKHFISRSYLILFYSKRSYLTLLHSTFSMKLIRKIEELGLESYTRNEVWRCIEEKTDELLNTYSELDLYLYDTLKTFFLSSGNPMRKTFFMKKIRDKEKEFSELDSESALLGLLRITINDPARELSKEQKMVKEQMVKVNFEMGKKMYEDFDAGLRLIDRFIYQDMFDVLNGFVETVKQKGIEKEKKQIKEILLKKLKKYKNSRWAKKILKLYPWLKNEEIERKGCGTISLIFPIITHKSIADIMFGREVTTTKPFDLDELKPIKIGSKKDISVNLKIVPYDKKNNVPGQSSNFRFKQTGLKAFDFLIEEHFFKNYKNTLMYNVYKKVEFRKMEKAVLLGKLPLSFDKPEDLIDTKKTRSKAGFDAPAMVEALFEVCKTSKDFESLINQIEDYFKVADTWKKLIFVGANDKVQTTIDLGEIGKIKEILEQKKKLFIEMIKGIQKEFNSRSLLGAEKIDSEVIEQISNKEAYNRFLKIYS